MIDFLVSSTLVLASSTLVLASPTLVLVFPVLVTFCQQACYGFFATLAIIERQIVYPHCHEAIGQLRLHVAGKLHGISEGILAVFH